ncbi:hypothetical protein HN51_021311 [Arachis hypogaea]
MEQSRKIMLACVAKAEVEEEGQRSKSLVKKRDKEMTKTNEMMDPSVVAAAAEAFCGGEDQRKSEITNREEHRTSNGE